MENILEKLVNNSRKAIDNGVYDISESLSNSGMDLGEIIINSQPVSYTHLTLPTICSV